MLLLDKLSWVMLNLQSFKFNTAENNAQRPFASFEDQAQGHMLPKT